MDKNKATTEEEKVFDELDREIKDLEDGTEQFEKRTSEQVSNINDTLALQEEEFDALEKEVASFEEKNKDEIDSLAIKSIAEE